MTTIPTTYNEQKALIAATPGLTLPTPPTKDAVRAVLEAHFGKPDHPDVDQAPLTAGLPTLILSEVTPGHPRQLSLSLSGPRRRRLHALLAHLKAEKAEINGRRGTVEAPILVATFNDAIYWLLDQLPAEKESGN